MSWQLFQQDALTWLHDQSAEQYDALVTDPPYSSGGLHAGSRTADSANSKYVNDPKKYPEFSGENRDQHSYMLWSTLWLTEAHRVLKPGSPFIVFTDWRQLSVMIDAVQAAGFTYRGASPGTRRKLAGRPRGGSASRPSSSFGDLRGHGTTRMVPHIRGSFVVVLWRPVPNFTPRESRCR